MHANSFRPDLIEMFTRMHIRCEFQILEHQALSFHKRLYVVKQLNSIYLLSRNIKSQGEEAHFKNSSGEAFHQIKILGKLIIQHFKNRQLGEKIRVRGLSFAITLSAHFRPKEWQSALARNVRKSAKSRFQVFSSRQWALISRQLLASFRGRKEGGGQERYPYISDEHAYTDSHSETLWKKERERERERERGRRGRRRSRWRVQMPLSERPR